MSDSPGSFPRLTERERQCVAGVAAGLHHEEIAARLGITDKTVEKLMASARRHLGANSREHAVAIALQHDLLTGMLLNKDE